MNKLSKILTGVAALIGIVAFFFLIRIILTGDETLKTDLEAQASIVSPFVSFSIAMLVITAVITVLFSLVNLLKQPEVLKKSLISVGALAVVLIIAYSTAGSEQVMDAANIEVLSEAGSSTSKWVSTLITYSFILGAIGLIFILFDFIKSLIKN
ncbi:hypothetical protein [Aureivirga sp. CE67]|uniref:hypothetical protein n=1 Tax=Aureivirga sp. CE67 TaxID=1788983 RepID=UPI0018CB34F6|nr:hypothetical protein [Aureivirga sp. CE67]